MNKLPGTSYVKWSVNVCTKNIVYINWSWSLQYDNYSICIIKESYKQSLKWTCFTHHHYEICFKHLLSLSLNYVCILNDLTVFCNIQLSLPHSIPFEELLFISFCMISAVIVHSLKNGVLEWCHGAPVILCAFHTDISRVQSTLAIECAAHFFLCEKHIIMCVSMEGMLYLGYI